MVVGRSALFAVGAAGATPQILSRLDSAQERPSLTTLRGRADLDAIVVARLGVLAEQEGVNKPKPDTLWQLERRKPVVICLWYCVTASTRTHDIQQVCSIGICPVALERQFSSIRRERPAWAAGCHWRSSQQMRRGLCRGLSPNSCNAVRPEPGPSVVGKNGSRI